MALGGSAAHPDQHGPCSRMAVRHQHGRRVADQSPDFSMAFDGIRSDGHQLRPTLAAVGRAMVPDMAPSHSLGLDVIMIIQIYLAPVEVWFSETNMDSGV